MRKVLCTVDEELAENHSLMTILCSSFAFCRISIKKSLAGGKKIEKVPFGFDQNNFNAHHVVIYRKQELRRRS